MQTAKENRWPKWMGRKPPTGLPGAVFWLAVWFCLLFLLRRFPGGTGAFFALVQLLVGIALAATALPLLVRIVRRRMLWSLRNKLVITYLLIGLAPVILFLTLVLISAYVAAGQFAIHLVDSRIQEELAQMSSDNAHRVELAARLLQGSQIPPAALNSAELSGGLDAPRRRLHRESLTYINGAPMVQGANKGKTPMGLPPWAAELRNGQFNGLVLDGGDLYLTVVNQHRMNDGRLLSLVTSLIVDKQVMDMIAGGLGHAQLFAERLGSDPSAKQPANSPDANGRTAVGERLGRRREASISGGMQAPGANLADIQVRFLSTLGMTDWGTGERDNVLVNVDSRPSLLYNQLFGASLGGLFPDAYRIGLIALCVFFALIELLALVMAIRLSKTMTASVADLYHATQKIDQGEFSHRIGVTREDQLAELSRSFNKMTGSLQRLLQEQKEKERLQNELTIAQEVQANLFPRQVTNLPTLELHGVCRPARSVSGDYYDFLVFHEAAHNGHVSRNETGVGIAIGDISGKGISAALLMATLHSAVRAYRFASEELVYSESALAGLLSNRDELGSDCDELFQSPGRILSLLNRHLYRSTQPEKYATLFLAHYDARSAMMTYSNAGQLPPLVLGQDGVVRRLDRGGTVVGLMDGMQYEEDRFQMRPGDILVGYSDGVTEPENDFGEFGEERMMEVVRRYRDQPLHVISSQVMQALDAWIGAEEQPDDITLVLARQV
ncbi:PP2C family protein-serine/threonine phosphatase [Edaphobacter modestus]|uniref:Sigma-B regulation protein RsbU (Phosphoserine phosphatase) n=1 Tax=Edaphobacter modestus TaxID=388466 RepID=A0A4Q7YT27_9BACT|nr:SpoIIE family protein phosphatase [Edaphobacter modestus]RZU40025.1 sigma-B regulation protein RsbU (phosphoserine phosphatase) [Edaphobacter modestus]